MKLSVFSLLPFFLLAFLSVSMPIDLEKRVIIVNTITATTTTYLYQSPPTPLSSEDVVGTPSILNQQSTLTSTITYESTTRTVTRVINPTILIDQTTWVTETNTDLPSSLPHNSGADLVQLDKRVILNEFITSTTTVYLDQLSTITSTPTPTLNPPIILNNQTTVTSTIINDSTTRVVTRTINPTILNRQVIWVTETVSSAGSPSSAPSDTIDLRKRVILNEMVTATTTVYVVDGETISVPQQSTSLLPGPSILNQQTTVTSTITYESTTRTITKTINPTILIKQTQWVTETLTDYPSSLIDNDETEFDSESESDYYESAYITETPIPTNSVSTDDEDEEFEPIFISLRTVTVYYDPRFNSYTNFDYPTSTPSPYNLNPPAVMNVYTLITSNYIEDQPTPTFASVILSTSDLSTTVISPN
ncbi:uncharacterized protein ASCRUDRAFT_76012 [Ascoidea rubescens DSM 1968]|uniref:Uncharacterized protein n=1 Tax=Ascoidea rubescens DSM 1968 TaxID=1344418 RepID=A0A1D2VGE3_9ASCO|nr:hypothetical protein ASCRUDRAFT_76012 [Ascoidea rubescens DSM 1968]ODV60610.1 hypothetical protein ASCRUDRAFT_76012 [Ascoidea rubescens DSM 1968]